MEGAASRPGWASWTFLPRVTAWGLGGRRPTLLFVERLLCASLGAGDPGGRKRGSTPILGQPPPRVLRLRMNWPRGPRGLEAAASGTELALWRLLLLVTEQQ